MLFFASWIFLGEADFQTFLFALPCCLGVSALRLILFSLPLHFIHRELTKAACFVLYRISNTAALSPEGNEAFWELQCTTYHRPLQWKHRLAACGYSCTSVQVDGWL
ncbi:hypothetical protein CHARACLAT_007631 [Characodon lateralis]|uniref:Secreted protein n=1 Tax=Characodon lateralis TaxID=208331 RepID=A0ABU7ERW5_9TELE|nr:hypothetical protein [Characodon lateralis]